LLLPTIEFPHQLHYSLTQHSFTEADQLKLTPLRLGEMEHSFASNLIAVFITFDLLINKDLMRLRDALERYLHPMLPILLPPE
jgi:hypothetical protein